MSAGRPQPASGFFILIAFIFVGAAHSRRPGEDLMEHARRIHKDAIVVDTHLDVPMSLRQKWADLSLKGATPQFDIPRAREGGLTAPFFAIYVPVEFAEEGGAVKEAVEIIDLVDSAAAGLSADLQTATCVADVRSIKKAGKMAVLMGLEGGHAIEDSLAALRGFYRLGIRYLTLTHVRTTHWADSSGAPWLPDYDPKILQVHHGLNSFGNAVVREMNRLGMMIDVSHASDETTDDVLAVSRAPVFASHSSCRALSDSPRNISDDQIRRIAGAGGVVMINFSSEFLDQKCTDVFRAFYLKIRPEYVEIKRRFADNTEERSAAMAKLYKESPFCRAPWTKVVDHIEHVIKIAGPDAVGLGTDYDGIRDPPDGLEDVSQLPRITEELLRRGFSEEVVLKVLGENFLRFFARVEEVARTLSPEAPSIVRIDK